MDLQRSLEDEFAIVELEPREVTSPDAHHTAWCGSGGFGFGSGAPVVSVGSGGSGGSGGGSGT